MYVCVCMYVCMCVCLALAGFLPVVFSCFSAVFSAKYDVAVFANGTIPRFMKFQKVSGEHRMAPKKIILSTVSHTTIYQESVFRRENWLNHFFLVDQKF